MASSTAAYSYEQGAVVQLPRENLRRVINAPRHPWNEGFINRISDLMKLQRNWNGYGAEPVGFHAAQFAVSMVASACPPYVSEPQVVPGPNGDLQIEWHSLEYDIELHVVAPFEVSAVRYTGGNCEEIQLSNDFTIVSEWLDQMESAIAARAAAA